MDVDGEFLTWLFLAGGILLMILELVVPGGVAFFLGLSGLAVGLLRFLGLLSDPVWAITAWLLTSMSLTIAIRPFIRKYLKPESSFKLADEDYEAMDQIAIVTDELNDRNNSGRIRFDGVTWQARSMEGRIPAGKEVVIRHRENTTWIVESIGGSELSSQKLQNPERN
ncbi:NfeD family protein [Rhodohalobacter mucosus]|uniref:Nodulation protein NfeD n=1 Tax=Rhodohalobacter mucosus TaxID=2079485 RepID=A0A316TUV6_9BACT|nr:NfeD family protein [Rhodohalobacter mucosus]PWN07501.1 nodulation protein NfeD [Rhodohalobacter mucosus]